MKATIYCRVSTDNQEREGTSYYADYLTNAHNWQYLIMTNTITKLVDSSSESYKLVEEWKDA